ncbi:ATP-binding protein [Streptomyces cavernicola]|uniref:ATP-binding protein n=1 Tax=Streptomyces cavernicola TaxID=3043613 RepID=A0ABT6SG52_9ACTN|nr:ATP-binding protein [Streptomyces sp. B-S-A6]MDI3407180.1 ATP-binding protein [Streptomyces sp. B-S-A6]
MTGSTDGHAPHPYVGGRAAALRALAAWRMEWPGTPRVTVLTGAAGSGRSRLLTGFLMLCDPDFREQLPLDEMDPSTVPPKMPAPVVPSPAGRTAAQLLWLLADHLDIRATATAEVFAELAASTETHTVIVPDVDRSGPLRAVDEAGRLVRDVLKPLAGVENVRVLVDLPRPLARELAAGLAPGAVKVIDLDEPQWADPEGLALHAEAALSPQCGAPDLPFTTDPAARRALASALAQRAGNALVVQLAAHCILMAPEGFDPADEEQLPSSVGEAMDLHARRLGVEPGTLRSMLTPLALAEGPGLPVEFWARLAGSVAGQDMTQTIAQGMALAGPFVEAAESDDVTVLRLFHPAIGEEVRSGLANVRSAQTQIAMALLESVPEQNWGKAGAYVRDHIAGHTLAAGLLPQLLTDPGLFVHADPIALRAAVEAVPFEELGAPARTYLRIAPLFTRAEVPASLRAALLETAFVEDGLIEYAAAVRTLGFELPWQTLWSTPTAGVRSVAVGSVQSGETPVPVALLGVASDTVDGDTADGGSPVSQSDVDTARILPVLHHLEQAEQLTEVAPELFRRPSEEALTTAPLALSRGADYLRVWDRESEEVVAALISDVPFTAADLSPDGVLVLATRRGVKALRIRPGATAIVS